MFKRRLLPALRTGVSAAFLLGAVLSHVTSNRKSESLIFEDVTTQALPPRALNFVHPLKAIPAHAILMVRHPFVLTPTIIAFLWASHRWGRHLWGTTPLLLHAGVGYGSGLEPMQKTVDIESRRSDIRALRVKLEARKVHRTMWALEAGVYRQDLDQLLDSLALTGDEWAEPLQDLIMAGRTLYSKPWDSGFKDLTHIPSIATAAQLQRFFSAFRNYVDQMSDSLEIDPAHVFRQFYNWVFEFKIHSQFGIRFFHHFSGSPIRIIRKPFQEPDGTFFDDKAIEEIIIPNELQVWWNIGQWFFETFYHPDGKQSEGYFPHAQYGMRLDGLFLEQLDRVLPAATLGRSIRLYRRFA